MDTFPLLENYLPHHIQKYVDKKLDQPSKAALFQLQQTIITTIKVDDLIAFRECFTAMTRVIDKMIANNSAPMVDEIIYTTKQVAEKLHRNPKTILDWVEKGRLTATPTGKGFLFKHSDVMKLMT